VMLEGRGVGVNLDVLNLGSIRTEELVKRNQTGLVALDEFDSPRNAPAFVSQPARPHPVRRDEDEHFSPDPSSMDFKSLDVRSSGLPVTLPGSLLPGSVKFPGTACEAWPQCCATPPRPGFSRSDGMRRACAQRRDIWPSQTRLTTSRCQRTREVKTEPHNH
jgi:hypothetical protein